MSKGITVISAVGNDGPFYGTINNPGDLSDVLSVGGLAQDGETLAAFSSRGMTTLELLDGMGRIKPDIVTYSKFVKGAGLDIPCQTKSGTSVSAPIVSGVVAMVYEYNINRGQKHLNNPGFVR